MSEIDRLRMKRRELEVEINRIKEKLDEKVALKKDLDQQIVMLQQERSGEFRTSLFG